MVHRIEQVSLDDDRILPQQGNCEAALNLNHAPDMKVAQYPSSLLQGTNTINKPTDHFSDLGMIL